MPLHPGFVAAVLEGIEGTLGELIDRADDSPQIRAGLDALQDKVVALRTSLDREAAEADAEEAQSVYAGTEGPATQQENVR
jgi:hypothetical protein